MKADFIFCRYCVLLFYISSSVFLRVLLFLGTNLAHAAIISAPSCLQADVQAAMASAKDGETVEVPAGSCTWSGMSIVKAIHLKGAGTGQTNISVSDNAITKQAIGIIRISDFSFTKRGGGNGSKAFTVGGSWLNAEPVVFENNSVTISNSGFFRLNIVGGMVIANNSFIGEWDDSFIQPQHDNDTENSWGTADTMGDRDDTGTLNIYVESNTFYGGTNQNIDCSSNARCVYRYNDLTYSSFNSHGFATSPASVRHWEVYNNVYRYPFTTDQIGAQNWLIWIRGATGVIFNNAFVDIAGNYWGEKDELRFSIRGAEDVRPQGSCADVSYPVPQQLGQNHDGAFYFTDPIYIWGNSGTQAIGAGWSWGNPCNLDFSDFWQENRDYVVGIAKPGYTPYTYPHPLASGVGYACSDSVDNDGDGFTDYPSDPGCLGTTDDDESDAIPDTTSPTAPANLHATSVSTSQINLFWTASSDDVGVQSYAVERCAGSGCDAFAQVANSSGAAYSDIRLSANTIYRYRVRAMDFAGNRSSFSSSVNAATQNPAPPTTGTYSVFTFETPVGSTTDCGTCDYELGMKFQSSVDGEITAVRFYKSTSETGTHVGNIWSSSGTLLASVGFTGESESGWQQQALATPLAIVANTTYIVSVNTGNTFYVFANRGLAAPITNGPLSTIVGSNGVYSNAGAPGSFPSNTYQDSNYFRDVVFTTGAHSFDPSLVAAYSFDEGTASTADRSGNGNQGAISGAQWAIGKHASALYFDGIDDLFTVSDSDFLDLIGEMTL